MNVYNETIHLRISNLLKRKFQIRSEFKRVTDNTYRLNGRYISLEQVLQEINNDF